MPRLANNELSSTPRGYRISIGFYMKDGRKTPRVIWLGHDHAVAQYVAHTWRTAWVQLKATGQEFWTDESMNKVKSFLALGNQMLQQGMDRAQADKADAEARINIIREAATLSAPAMVDEQPKDAPEPEVPTLYGAIQAYVASVNAKALSDSHKLRVAMTMNTLKTTRPDRPLSEINYAWLESLADHFKNRPIGTNGRKLSAATVSTTLRYLRLLFVWMDDSRYGNWEGPRRLNRVFKVRTRDLMTPVELKEAQTIKQFDLATLTKFYAVASDFQRRLLLMGLFVGTTQVELSILEKSEFDLDAATLHHFRGKTTVEGKYWLPPELVELMRADFKARPKDKLAFVSPKGGTPLVIFRNNKRVCDIVRDHWEDLRTAAGLPTSLPYKYCRKFLGDWMVKHGGADMGQVALSHARQTIIGKNYTSARDFEAFAVLQRQMHAELTTAGVFTA